MSLACRFVWLSVLCFLASKASVSNLLLLLLLWKRATTVIVAWTARKQLTISGKPDLLNCCALLWHIQFTNVAAGRITQPGRPRVGDPCSKPITSLRIPLAKVDAMLYIIYVSASFNMDNPKLQIILLPKPIFTPFA
jgi:hypothetical protein